MSMRVLQGREGRWLVGACKLAHVPAKRIPPNESAFERLVRDFERSDDSALTATENSDPYHVTVLTSTLCNLACPYCFQNTSGSPDGAAPPRIDGNTLTHEVVGRIISFVERQVRQYGKPGVHLHLFGGEPLLAHDLCIELLHGLAHVPLRSASIQTNATLLNSRRVNELAAAGLRDIHVTLDGDEDTHNSLRHNRNGRPTYGLILRRLQEASVNTEVRWTVRINVSNDNFASVYKAINDLQAVLPSDRTKIYFAILRDFGFGIRNELDASAHVREALMEAQRIACEAGFSVQVSGGRQRCNYCGELGGRCGAVIGPTGHLYSCWESAGRPEFVVGTVDSGYISDAALKSRWVACEFGAKDPWLDDVRQDLVDSLDSFTLDWLRDHNALRRRVDVRSTL